MSPFVTAATPFYDQHMMLALLSHGQLPGFTKQKLVTQPLNCPAAFLGHILKAPARCNSRDVVICRREPVQLINGSHVHQLLAWLLCILHVQKQLY